MAASENECRSSGDRPDLNRYSSVISPRRITDSAAGGASTKLSRMKSWHSAHRKEVCIVLSPEWFQRMGLVFLDDFSPASLK